jgi:hypothetical protein
MKALILGVLMAWSVAAAEEIFRVSRVVEAAGDGVERVTFKVLDHEEVLFVKMEAVLNADDVQEAWAEISPSMRSLSIRLMPEAAKKLAAVTGEMRLGVERLAVFVEGRPISAPIVNSKLGAQVMIEGFEDRTDEELKELARKMAGRLPGAEKPGVKVPEQKWEPYTDEEYQSIKARRAKLGIFYLDSMRSEEELDALLVEGMTRAEVMAALGKPTSVEVKPGGDGSLLIYQVAPEKWNEKEEEGMNPLFFMVRFGEDRLISHDVHYAYGTRELKRPGWEPPLLRLSAPEPDFSGDTQTVLQYFESVKAEDPKQAVNRTDLAELIELAMMLERMQVGEGAPPPEVNAGCDLILTLAHHFPEVAELRDQAKDGSIPVAALCDALTAYSSGRKPFPASQRENGTDGGAGPPVDGGAK